MPEAIVIAGPNGAGKTTLARQLLPLEHPDAAFLNADEILASLGPSASIMDAGRLLITRRAHQVERGESFAVETTLASRSYARDVPRWRGCGYRVILYFVELPSEDLAVKRVARRVAAGGHDIPEPAIRRRFARGSKNFHHVFKASVDEWYHLVSDDRGIRLLDCGP